MEKPPRPVMVNKYTQTTKQSRVPALKIILEEKGTGEIKDFIISTAFYIRRRFKIVHDTLSSYKGPLYATMFTFTVRSKEEEEEAVRSISKVWNALVHRILRKTKVKILCTVRKTEAQKRGVLHFHYLIYTTAPLFVSSLPDWLKPDLSLWKYGWTNVQRVKKPLGYLLNYLKKTKTVKTLVPLVLDLEILRKRYPGKKLWYVYLASVLRTLRYKLQNAPLWVRERVALVIPFEQSIEEAVKDILHRGRAWVIVFMDGKELKLFSPYNLLLFERGWIDLITGEFTREGREDK